VRNRVGGSNERQGRHDYFVAGLNASQEQGNLQANGSVRNRDGVLCTGDVLNALL
jgi:hypothetical protein